MNDDKLLELPMVTIFFSNHVTINELQSLHPHYLFVQAYLCDKFFEVEHGRNHLITNYRGGSHL